MYTQWAMNVVRTRAAIVRTLFLVNVWHSNLLHSRGRMKEMENAFESLPAVQQELLRRCYGRVQAFAKSQMANLVHMEMDIPGVCRNPEFYDEYALYVIILSASQFCRGEGRT